MNLKERIEFLSKNEDLTIPQIQKLQQEILIEIASQIDELCNFVYPDVVKQYKDNVSYLRALNAEKGNNNANQ